MRRAIIGYANEEAQSEINLTPMLDVVFIMLIFFIVVASFMKEAGLDVNRSDALVLPPEDVNILIRIAEDSGIWMDDRLIDPRSVKANIARTRGENPNAAVIIQAHKRSANKTFVQVMDASRQAGIINISLQM